MFTFYYLVNMALAYTGLDILGSWSEVHKCNIPQSEMITFGYTQMHISGSVLDWWITDGVIMLGDKNTRSVRMAISVDYIANNMLVGKLVIAKSETVTDLVLEKCY